MKKLIPLLALMLGFVAAHAAPPAGWLVDYDAALKKAKAENKYVYVLFTGSDWCPWCVRLRKDVLTKAEFRSYAAQHFVPVYCDFPRKTKLAKEQQKKQLQAAKQLGFKGDSFPTAVIVDSDGNVVGRIGRYLPLAEYLDKLKSIVK